MNFTLVLWGAPCILSIYDVGVSAPSTLPEQLGRLCGEGKPPFDDSQFQIVWSNACGKTLFD